MSTCRSVCSVPARRRLLRVRCRLRDDRAGHAARPRSAADALAEQHLRRRYPPTVANASRPFVLDVRHDDADLVDVPDERKRRRAAPRPRRRARTTCRACPIVHLRERSGRLAPDARRLALAARRARSASSSEMRSGGRSHARLRIQAEAPTVTAMTSAPAPGGALAPRAGREPRRVARDRDSLNRSTETREGLFRLPMIASTVVDTDLVTPLGAYLRLRDAGRASSCSSRSSRGGSGATRSSAAARGCSPTRRPRRSASRSSATSAYDFVAKLEPTVPLPDAGRGLPESRFVVADVARALRPRARVAEVLRGDPRR